ncbi:MAG: restriction endonuclease [Candidatus Aminicenantales bacterium]
MSKASKIPHDHIVAADFTCEINGECIEGEQAELIYEWVYDQFPEIKNCPFCGTSLRSADFYKEQNDPESKRFVFLVDSTLWSCDYCAYWQWYWHEGKDNTASELISDAYISKLRDFEGKLPEGPDDELAQAVRRDKNIWHTISPARLEKLVASVFKANHGDCEVFHVGKPSDGGVDVVFIDSREKQWLIQVKRRGRPNSSEGVATIRNLLGALDLKDSLNGILVSTADHFTYRAYEAVGRAKERGKIIKLFDRGKLNRMVGPLLPDRPWLSIVEDFSPSLSKYFSKKIPKINKTK